MPRARTAAASKHLRWSPHASSSQSASRRHAPPPPPAHSPSVQLEAPAAQHAPVEWIPANLLRYESAPSSSPRWTPLDVPTLLNGRGTPPTGNSTPLKLRLLTYNTFSCDPSHTASQTRALLAVLETARADVIALQEVSQPFYRALQSWAAAKAQGKGGGGWTMTSLQQVWDVQGPEEEAPSGPKRKRGLKEACVVLVREALLFGNHGGGGSNGGEVRIAKLDKSTDEGGKAAIGFRLIRNGHEVVSLPSLLFWPSS